MSEVLPAISLPLNEVSLFFDLDGTLAPFAPTPDEVGPDIYRNSLLREASMRLGGRLAIVSGRSLVEVDRILDGTVLAVAGSHGLQRRDSRLDLVTAGRHGQLDQAITEIKAFAAKFPDVLVEIKPLSVAFHYRGNASIAVVAEVFAEDLARRTGLRLQFGAMVAEFLSPGSHKGLAIQAFMGEPPFAGTVPLFVGDDLTDEDGFEAVHRLGGYGLLVGLTRQTYARYGLASTDAVQAWLVKALETGRFELEAPLESSYCRF